MIDVDEFCMCLHTSDRHGANGELTRIENFYCEDCDCENYDQQDFLSREEELLLSIGGEAARRAIIAEFASRQEGE